MACHTALTVDAAADIRSETLTMFIIPIPAAMFIDKCLKKKKKKKA